MFRISIVLAGMLFGAPAWGSGPGIFEMQGCTLLRYQQFYDGVRQKVEAQQVNPEFPFKAKVSFGVMAPSNQMVMNSAATTKTVYPDFWSVQLFGFAGVKDGQVDWWHQKDKENKQARTDEVPSDIALFRASNVEYLQQQYKEWGFPEITWRTLQQQEQFLAEHRKFEYAVSKGGKLLFFIRAYIGSHWKMMRGENETFKGETPFVEAFMTDGPFFYRRRIPTYMMPADLIQKDPYAESNPLNKLRAENSRNGIIEIGRFFIDRDAPKEDVAMARKIGLAMFADHLRDFAPSNDLSRLTVVATGGPAGARLYDAEFGLKPYAEITDNLGGNTLGPMYDVLGRKFDNDVMDATLVPEYRVGDDRKVRPNHAADPEDVKRITLLTTTGTVLMEKLAQNKASGMSLNLDEFPQNVATTHTEFVKPVPMPGPEGWKFK